MARPCRRGRVLDRDPGRPRIPLHAARRIALVERRRAQGRRLRRRHAPARRSEDGLALRAVHRSGAERRRHHARRKEARGTRRHRARRPHRADPARDPGAVPARPAVAAGDVPRARSVAGCARSGVRATRQARVERRLRAGGLGHRLARRPAPQPAATGTTRRRSSTKSTSCTSQTRAPNCGSTARANSTSRTSCRRRSSSGSSRTCRASCTSRHSSASITTAST